MLDKLFKMILSVWGCIMVIIGFISFGKALDCYDIYYFIGGTVCVISGCIYTYLYKNMK